jgi:hypothetical protein
MSVTSSPVSCRRYTAACRLTLKGEGRPPRLPLRCLCPSPAKRARRWWLLALALLGLKVAAPALWANLFYPIPVVWAAWCGARAHAWGLAVLLPWLHGVISWAEPPRGLSGWAVLNLALLLASLLAQGEVIWRGGYWLRRVAAGGTAVASPPERT